MPDYDAGFKIVARAAGPRRPQMAGIVCDKYEPIGGEVQATERLADRAFRAQSGEERFVVYMEAYTRWQEAAPWSILVKSGLLSERERLPTVSLVYVLLPRGYRSQRGRIRLSANGSVCQMVCFREICLWKETPQPWWEDSPGLMALYPFCRHGLRSADALTHAASAIRNGESDSLIRANLLTTLAIFGKLVDRKVDVLGLIGRQQMKESPLYQEIMDEGKIETARTCLQAVLDGRFGNKATPFTKAIHGINDEASLLRLHRLAIRCRGLAEFKRGLSEEALS